MGVTIPIGSAVERIPGIGSILVSHLQRNTNKMQEDNFADYLDNHGIATFGAANRTSVMLGLTSPPQHADKGLQLLSQMMFEPSFQPDSINQLIQSQIGYIQQIQSTPESILSNYTRWKSAFKDDPITKHPLGEVDQLQQINTETLLKWHGEVINHKPYFAAVGIDISEKKLEEYGLNTFLSQFGTKATTTSPITEAQEDFRVEIDKPQMESSNAYIGVNIRGKDPKEGSLEENLFQSILSGGNSARLFVEIREKRNLSYAPRVTASRFIGGSFMTAIMDVRPDRAEEALLVTLTTMKNVLDQPISEIELRRSIKSALKVALFVADSSSTYTSFILSRMMTGRDFDMEQIKKKLNGILKTEWQKVLKENWTKNKLSLAIAGETGDLSEKWIKIAEELQ
jgi:zinc protease